LIFRATQILSPQDNPPNCSCVLVRPSPPCTILFPFLLVRFGLEFVSLKHVFPGYSMMLWSFWAVDFFFNLVGGTTVCTDLSVGILPFPCSPQSTLRFRRSFVMFLSVSFFLLFPRHSTTIGFRRLSTPFFFRCDAAGVITKSWLSSTVLLSRNRRR